jgi:hypothetical protein
MPKTVHRLSRATSKTLTLWVSLMRISFKNGQLRAANWSS